MIPASSHLDRPAARAIAAIVALVALGLAGWLVYIDARDDPAVAGCIKEHTAAIQGARDKGAIPADVAQRFIAKIAESCRAQVDAMR